MLGDVEHPSPPPERPAYPRPATAEALRAYLLGSWTVKKATTYTRGGISGRFDGEAAFRLEDYAGDAAGAAAEARRRTQVRYTEHGTFAAAGKGGMELRTRNAQLYDFGDPSKLDVFFVDPDEAAGEEGSGGRPASARYLHSVDPATLAMTEEDDGMGNVYRGTLDIAAADAFLLSWEVTGPSKEGSIISMFSRRKGGGEPGPRPGGAGTASGAGPGWLRTD